MTLSTDADETYARRSALGDRAIVLAVEGLTAAAFYVIGEEDRRTGATDIISDVLTTIVGPAGNCEPDGRVVYSTAALDQARALLDAAFESYKGDAEDYDVEA